MSPLPKASVVLFVRDVSSMATYYKSLALMDVIHDASDHVVLEVAGLQLVIHALHGNATPELATNGTLHIRRDAHVKVCLPVESIAAARTIAASLGGAILPPDNEWEARGFRACDGYDPEGNVLQVRE